MKKYFYIVSFTFLGFLLQLLFHAIFENWYIGFLVYDFERYGLGISWDSWFFIHHIFTILLSLLGVLFGFWQGKHWWNFLYDENGKAKKNIKNLFCKNEK